MPDTIKKNQWFWSVYGPLFAGSLLRLISYHFDSMISRDGILYLQASEIWFQDGFAMLLTNPDYYFPPVFLWSVQLLMHCGLMPLTAGITVNFVAGMLLIAVMYQVGRLLFDSAKWAWLLAMLTACHPVLIRYSVEIQRESLYLLFASYATMNLIDYLRSNRLSCCCLAGAAYSLALLTRYEGFLLFISINCVWVAMMIWRSADRRRHWRGWILFLLSFPLSCWLFISIMGVPVSFFSRHLAPRMETVAKGALSKY